MSQKRVENASATEESRPRQRQRLMNDDSTTTETLNLLSLPVEMLDKILSYTLPDQQCQQWEWIGVLCSTCMAFRPIGQSLVPSRLFLDDFAQYTPLMTGKNQIKRNTSESILDTLLAFPWKRQNLKEIHVHYPAVQEQPREKKEQIRRKLRSLLTRPSSLPRLEWLDVELQSDFIHNFTVVDAGVLRQIPSASPSLQKICLCNCFSNEAIITVDDLKQFFEALRFPLISLSICEATWMSDEHVEAMMPLIGEGLKRVELIDCSCLLSDSSMNSIAKHCSNLRSFAMTGTGMTSAGLQSVLSANPYIVTLNLGGNRMLDIGTVHVIIACLPRLTILRNYWAVTNWLNNATLAALVDSQVESSTDGTISLELIGKAGSTGPTARGLEYAVKKGVKSLEVFSVDQPRLYERLVESDATMFEACYVHFIDGSDYCHRWNHYVCGS